MYSVLINLKFDFNNNCLREEMHSVHKRSEFIGKKKLTKESKDPRDRERVNINPQNFQPHAVRV
jgi:hypothetical protein